MPVVFLLLALLLGAGVGLSTVAGARMMRRLPCWAAYLAMMPLTFGFVATRV
ncbi:MAG: hypothetical protein IPP90_13235, partial [Gemmatimonadaceae bacterium]|nr:hypothetical protein [Gemmatimonadaceae bacterium]